MKIIGKKIKSFYGNKNGLIRPIFEISDNGEIKEISTENYPNNGMIFVADFELLNNDIKSELFLIDNDFFIQDDYSYQDRISDINACKKRINYNTRISNYFKKIEPYKFIPIYNNSFSITNNEIDSPDNIINTIFLLKDSAKNLLFGPFERNGKELKAANFKYYEEQYDDDFLNFIDDYERNFDTSTIFEISLKEALNFIITDNEENEYLEDFKIFIDKKVGKPIDFTPIISLHKWVIDKLEKKAPSISLVLKDIKNIVSTNSSPNEKLKWNKYVDYLEKIEKEETNIEQVVQILYSKNFIKDGIDSSEIEKLEKLEKQYEDIKAEITLKDTVISNLKDSNIQLNAEIKEEKRNSKEKSNIDSNLYPNLSNAINLGDSIIEIEKILKEKITSVELEKENSRLSIRKEILEEDIKRKENDVREIQKSVEEITKVFNRSASDHTAKLQEAKIYTDLLNGIEILKSNDQSEESKKMNVNIVSLKNSDINTSKVYISEIKKRLAKYGRDLSFNDVANLIITINQSFITIIAGAPGVGKTSLVEKLSKVYGLNENFGYLEIPCAKGWTSSKDLIGFFNPLTNKFQPAKTKLKEALKKSEEFPNSPYLILLDEANLSPIEHYWSDFIKLADSDYPRKIKISESEEIKFGQGFRFIATINHDHTTEALSNRLIDRAAVIQLEKPNVITEINDISDNIKTIFDFIELENLFIETSKWKTEEELIKDTFNKIKEKLEFNHTIIISPRKEIAIYKYCKVATGLLDGNSYVALDYAISQHILPLINGRGDSFEELLRNLKRDFNDKDMTKSEKLINKIIEKGKELKHFKYIYY